MIANIFQPLIDFFEQILLWFHGIGLSWGWSIIAMTVVVRAALLPLTFKQFKSMQALASHAPEMKKLQDRYKHDKERLNQEMMKFYRENKINPFASCLPLLAQLPVFLSLFYMLQKDLRLDICPEVNPPGTTNPQPCGDGGDASFFFIPDLTNKATGAVLVVLIILYVGSQLAVHAADVDDDGPDAADDLPGAAVLLRHLHHQLPGRPARLLDHHEPVDDRAAGDHPEAPRADAATGPGGRHGARRPVARRRRRWHARAAAAAGGGNGNPPKGKPSGPPPAPPRRKKKRSGRRR